MLKHVMYYIATAGFKKVKYSAANRQARKEATIIKKEEMTGGWEVGKIYIYGDLHKSFP
jgi:hypothetical protein